MKGIKFLIFGNLVVAGVIAFEIYKHFKGTKDNCQEKTSHNEKAFCFNESASPPDNSYEAQATYIFETKETVVDSVQERHYGAAKVVEESFNTIFKENNDETIVTENSDILDKTNNDLNDLLK